MTDWISFYDSDHPIYVNARHREVHARELAEGFLPHLRSPGAAMLDYGPGEALYAEAVAPRAGKLILCEAAPNMRTRVAARLSAFGNVDVCPPDALAKMADGSIDLIVLHSVSQYLQPAELDALLREFRRLLRQQGIILVGDVIRPETSPFADAFALLRFGAENGFFFAALTGLARTYLSDYRKVRETMGLARYSETEMTNKLNNAGLAVTRAPRNIGHNQARMLFIARPA